MIGKKTMKTPQGWTDHNRWGARIFFGLKAANVKPPKASLDAMDILKLTGVICGSVLVEDYAVYKKWLNE